MILKSLILLQITWLLASTSVTVAADSGEWLADFNTTCARTAEAWNLSREELRSLITACERVKKRIEAQDESVGKVYLKRARMSLDLFQYLLDAPSTMHKETSPPAAAIDGAGQK